VEAFLILGVLIALPVIFGLTMRVSASHLFFSVMAGELLARYFGHDAFSVIESFSRNTTLAGYAEAIVLTIPLVLTAVFLKGSLSRGKTVLHIIPFAVTGIVYAAFMLPVLPGSVQEIIKNNSITNQFFGIDSFIIGIIVFFQLVALWLLNRGHSKHGKKHKK
jgi:hypothetical protein